MSATLWAYRGIQIQEPSQVPMMGVAVSRQFVVAFVAGLIFVGYVAWDRFRAPQSDAAGFRYRVMREVEVADLGGASAMRRAYFIYLTTLLALYVTMTFFGRLIVQTVNALNVVGIQVDATSLKFDSPQWPLTLAFGFAGLAPLIPQLRACESWLFRRAYRAVGIPVRIHQTTRNLLDLLNGGKASGDRQLAEALETRKSQLCARIAGTWIRDCLNVRSRKLDNALSVLAQLDLLVAFAQGGRGEWPGSSVSDSVRDLEQEIARQADDLLLDFDKRVAEAKAALDAVPPAAAEATRSAETSVDDAHAAEESAATEGGPTAPAAPGVMAAAGAGVAMPTTAGVLERRERYLADTVAKARALREELVAILAVYVERDADYEVVATDGSRRLRVRDDGLRTMLEQADPPNLAGSGPEFGTLVWIGIAAILYAIFAWTGLHPLLSFRASSQNFGAVLATATLETIRLLSLFWIPLLAAFAVRQYYCDENTWVARAADKPATYVEQRLIALGVGCLLAVVCLVGLAALWAFFIAKDVNAFRNNLVRGKPPFILYYPTMAVISAALLWFALVGADARARGSGWLAFTSGLFGAALVGSLHAAHIYLWLVYPSVGGFCRPERYFLLDLFARGCFASYGGLDFFVMPALAFLAISVLGQPHRLPSKPDRGKEAAKSAGGGSKVPAWALLLSLAACAVLHGSAATPQARPAWVVDAKPIVRVGFRADVEPFSYQIRPEGRGRDGKPIYAGYLADLCYWIFAGSDYSVQEVPITAETRFDMLRTHKIDVLCDPVTMRFSDGERSGAGVFSPIVFATGVSYLQRVNSTQGASVYIGYVHPSTADEVADRACRINLFSVVLAKDRDRLAGICDDAETAIRDSPGEVPHDCWTLDAVGSYRFCPMSSHQGLIDWFCTPPPEGSRAGLVYLGDREIILGKLQTWRERNRKPCEVDSETAAGDLTYEPYAIMTGIPSETDSTAAALRRSAITELVQRRIYEFFSFSSLARAKFDTYFLGPNKDRTMSPALAYLFLLNGVEEEQMFTDPAE